MKGGRKNLKRAVGDENFTLSDGHSIMQVVSLRGSNIIEVRFFAYWVFSKLSKIGPFEEVMDAKGEKSLAMFPAKISNSMWIKRGSFVVADASEREKVLESGGKISCILSQVLFFEQVRQLRKSPDWPEIFKSAVSDEPCGSLKGHTSTQQINETQNEDDSSDDDDGLPPLEANMNRVRPIECQSDPESDSDTESET
ncbi:hypothetical protein OROGR_003611 [Orobanche gracilis]